MVNRYARKYCTIVGVLFNMNNQFMMIFQVNMQADKCVIIAVRIFFSL